MQVQTRDRAALDPGYALTFRFQQKWAKYGERCRAEGIAFQPLVLESMGGFHESAVELTKKLGQALARSSGQEESIVNSHLFGRLSLLLRKSNTALIINRVPTVINAEVDGTS